MKYLIVSCLIMLFPILGTKAQVQPFNQINPGSCSNDKTGIVSPPKGVDFKIIVIIPPKDFDQAMVFNQGHESNGISSSPKAINPNSYQKVEQFFKLSPFPTRKSAGSVMHFWN